jgi:hypothetical protein
MSGPVVAIGFVLLVPSIIGMLVGISMLIGAVVGGSQASATTERETRTRLAALHIPEPIVADVVGDRPVDDSRLSGLTVQQVTAVHDAQLSMSTAKIGKGAGAACGCGFSALIIVGSFVGGLIGWLLVMRKQVLQCARCGAVVAAS